MKVLFGKSPMDPTICIPQLEKNFLDVTFTHCTETQDISKAIEDVEVYIGSMNREIFLRAKRLRWIQSPSCGIDHYLKIPEFMASDVILTTASSIQSVSVAESTIGMILAYTRGLAEGHIKMKKRIWDSLISRRLVVLKEAILGIVGFGAIGQALFQIARGFQMRVIAVNMTGKSTGMIDELWNLSRLDDLLRESDYVVITAPYTKDTINMIGEREIDLMKKSAMLLVMSRGGIVDERALIKALREGKLAAAAMDVFCIEPLQAESELRELDNLILTPHIAGSSQSEGGILLEIIIDNLGKFLREESPLRNQVNKEKQY